MSKERTTKEPRKTRITSEKVCAALVAGGSVKKAAAELAIQEAAIYNLLATSEFKQMYEYAIADMLSETANYCNSKVQEAISCIAGIMNDTTIEPQTRLQAARDIIKNAESMSEIVQQMREKAEKETDIFIV